MVEHREPVNIDYEVLVQPEADLSKEIDEAFGLKGLGILTVSNVPTLQEKRQVCLPLAIKIASLPDDIKLKYENKKSHYLFGWSHGKEVLAGKPDFSKGSFYANPQYDCPLDPSSDENRELIEAFPTYVTPNIWIDEVPELKDVFQDLGQLVVDVGTLLAFHCDEHIKKQNSNYKDNKLESIIKTSKCCKARLLHYFPISEQDCGRRECEQIIDESEPLDESQYSTWCGWHNDHGSLTGLVPAMFFNNNNPSQLSQTDAPKDGSGLYVKSREGKVVKVVIKQKNCLGFQIGESAQIHSGGVLQATPHAVKSSIVPGISRETLAVFMQPNWYEDMNIPDNTQASLVQDSKLAEKSLPAGVPLLSTRWNNQQKMTFGEFTNNCAEAYHRLSEKSIEDLSSV